VHAQTDRAVEQQVVAPGGAEHDGVFDDVGSGAGIVAIGFEGGGSSDGVLYDGSSVVRAER
jgi:hypothetical protein